LLKIEFILIFLASTNQRVSYQNTKITVKITSEVFVQQKNV